MRRSTLVLGTGLALGALGAMLVFTYVRGVEARASAGEEMIPVLRAERVIPAGTHASGLAGLVRPLEMPRRYAPPGAVGSVQAVAGQFATRRIDRGSTITASDFASAGSTKGVLAVPRGKEAIAISTTLAAGLAHYLEPGDRVSAYATFRGGDDLTRKIISNVEVLATGPNSANATERLTGGGAQPPGQVTVVLAVTPQEASRLVFAGETGRLWLTLVPRGQKSPPVADYFVVVRPPSVAGGAA